MQGRVLVVFGHRNRDVRDIAATLASCVVSRHRGLLTAQNSRRNVVLSSKVFQGAQLPLSFANAVLQDFDRCFGCNANVVFGEIYAARYALEFSSIVKRLSELAKLGLLGF